MSILDQLVKEIQEKHTTGTPGTARVGPNVHGPNGMFGLTGLERDVISSRVSAEGAASLLPVVGTTVMYPLYPYITGRTAAVGDQPEEECDNAPVAGNLKTCVQTAQFGIYQYKTRTLILNEIGSLVNAGETTDLRFVNDPLGAMLVKMIFPSIKNEEAALQLGREVLMRFVDVGHEFQDELSQQLYIGSGTGNEFAGLEVLVAEDHFDAATGQICESLASDVRDFGDQDVTTLAGSSAIVNALTGMVRFAKHKGKGMRFGTVDFRFHMRSQLFIEIVDIWACAYATSRCLADKASISFMGDEQVRARQAMMDGSYLLVDNVAIPVVQDDFMPEDGLGESKFSSDVYLVPYSVRGGRNALYFEHFDYSKGAVQGIRDGGLDGFFWTDRGAYMWVKQYQNWCVSWQAKIQPRLRLETPQLAGRLMNVAYTIDKHFWSPSPTMDYYMNGGNSQGYAPPSVYNSHTGELS